MPFNWRTPQGYLLFTVFNSITSICTVFSTVPTTCHYVGSCWLFISMAEDIDGDFRSLNDSIKMNCSGRELRQRLCNFIRVYTEVKQLSTTCKMPAFQICQSMRFLKLSFFTFQTIADLLANSTNSMNSKF